MDVDSAELTTLTAACDRHLGDPSRWFSPDGYPNSLALCIIDAIYSTGARYSSVENVVSRYREYRTGQACDADTDGVDELAATIEELGGPDAWATQIGNRRPTSTSANAPLKSEAIAMIASSLSVLKVRTTQDLRSLVDSPDLLVDVERAWRATPGQRSGITWDYALMLAQVPGVKADRMVIRFVARAIDRPTSRLTPATTAALVRSVAEAKGWSVIHLDHAIWRFESGRPFERTPIP